MSKKALKSRLVKIDMSNLSKFSGQNSANDEMVSSVHLDSPIRTSYLLSRIQGQKGGKNKVMMVRRRRRRRKRKIRRRIILARKKDEGIQ